MSDFHGVLCFLVLGDLICMFLLSYQSCVVTWHRQ